MLDRGSEAAVEVTVSLDPAAVTGWRVRTDIQPMAVISELMEAEELVRLHPDFQAAMAKRGITDFETVQVDAWPAGTSATRARTASAGPCGRLRASAARRQRVGPPGGRRDRAGRPEQARGAARRRPRGRADPAESGNFDVDARRCAAARRHQAARDHPAGGRRASPSTGGCVRWQRWQVARRLHAPRGPGAATRSATRTAAGCGRSCTARRCRRWSCPTATPAPRTTSRTPSTRARTGSGSPPRR